MYSNLLQIIILVGDDKLLKSFRILSKVITHLTKADSLLLEFIPIHAQTIQ
jgi:hypothetical protein